MTIMAPLTMIRIPTRENGSEAPVKTSDGGFSWGDRALIETRILRKIQTERQERAIRAGAPLPRPVLIHRKLVPGFMKQNVHKKLEKSGLVVVGAE